MKNDPVRRRWIDAWQSGLSDGGVYYCPRPRMGSSRNDTETEEEALAYVPGERLHVYVGTFMTKHTHSPRPQVTISNCKPRQGGAYKDVYQEVFVGPREEAIEAWRAHKRLTFT